jgi:hypothetical protein
MPRRASIFTQADITRALRGAIKGGLTPQRIEIDAAGKIVIFCDGPPVSVESDAGVEKRLAEALGWDEQGSKAHRGRNRR